jgi:hypothetical protein
MQRGPRPTAQIPKPKPKDENSTRTKLVKPIRPVNQADKSADHFETIFSGRASLIKEEVSQFMKRVVKSLEFRQMVTNEVKRQTERFENRLIEVEKKLEILASKINHLFDSQKVSRRQKMLEELGSYSPAFDLKSLSCSQKSQNSQIHQKNKTRSFQEMINNSLSLNSSATQVNIESNAINERISELAKKCSDLEENFKIQKIVIDSLNSQIQTIEANANQMSILSIHTKKKGSFSARSKSADLRGTKSRLRSDLIDMQDVNHNLLDSFHKKELPERNIIQNESLNTLDMNYSFTPNLIANFEEITENDNAKGGSISFHRVESKSADNSHRIFERFQKSTFTSKNDFPIDP